MIIILICILLICILQTIVAYCILNNICKLLNNVRMFNAHTLDILKKLTATIKDDEIDIPRFK